MSPHAQTPGVGGSPVKRNIIVYLCLDCRPFEDWCNTSVWLIFGIVGVFCVCLRLLMTLLITKPQTQSFVGVRRHIWKQVAWRKEREDLLRLSGCGFGAGNVMRSSSSHAFGKFKSG